MNLRDPGGSRTFRIVTRVVTVVLLVSACADEQALTFGPTAEADGAPSGKPSPVANPGTFSSELHCTADVRIGRVTCEVPEHAPVARIGAHAPAAPGDLVVGSQGKLVRLASSNVCFEAQCEGGTVGSGIFQADVTVQNLMGQALGTTDGETPDPDGVRVFFVSDPEVTGGSGAVRVANADGTAEFTSSGQSYFQYGGGVTPDALGEDGILTTEEVSEPRTWMWEVSPGVEAFVFTVAVSAAAPNMEALDKVRVGGRVITAGTHHTCALTGDGKAYCWGANGYGQLGNDDTEDSSVPVPVSGEHTFTWIDAGERSTCGVRTDGKVFCWGARALGRIGDGDTTGLALVPHEVDSEDVFVSVSVAPEHACALTADGRAFCWGTNLFGRLGVGTTSDHFRPAAVRQGDLVFSELVAGSAHTCALTANGKAYCWGYNATGRLGIGEEPGSQRTAPVEVIGGVTFRSLATDVRSHTCGIAVDGRAYCWGAGGEHQLGTGEATAQAEPAAVAGGKPEFASMTGGASYTCAVTVGGAAYCWGSNTNAQLGIGTQGGAPTPTPRLVVGGLSFSSISAATASHSCGITTEGVAYCWGSNTAGRLGIGTEGDIFPEPTRVAAPGGVSWKTGP